MSKGPVALVIGGAPTVLEDLERAQALTAGWDTITVAANDIGWIYEGRIDAWATLHPERFDLWRRKRAGRGLNEDYRAFAHRKRGGTMPFEVFAHGIAGSSGLYAAEVALQALGASGVILCGVPIEAAAGHIVQPGEWSLVEKYKPAWLAAKEEGLPIRSMGGWTAELFGEPDAEWIKSLRLARAKPGERTKEPSMRIKMLKTHNFVPPAERRIAVKYLQGGEYTVKRDWGEAMVAEGAAKEVKAPRKPAAEEADGGRG